MRNRLIPWVLTITLICLVDLRGNAQGNPEYIGCFYEENSIDNPSKIENYFSRKMIVSVTNHYTECYVQCRNGVKNGYVLMWKGNACVCINSAADVNFIRHIKRMNGTQERECCNTPCLHWPETKQYCGGPLPTEGASPSSKKTCASVYKIIDEPKTKSGLNVEKTTQKCLEENDSKNTIKKSSAEGKSGLRIIRNSDKGDRGVSNGETTTGSNRTLHGKLKDDIKKKTEGSAAVLIATVVGVLFVLVFIARIMVVCNVLNKKKLEKEEAKSLMNGKTDDKD